jgi:hypothetical protein
MSEMPLAIKVQSVAHTDLRTVGDSADGIFMDVCKDAVGKSCTLGFVVPFGDTMFNSFQLRQFVEDLDSALGARRLSPEHTRVLAEIRTAAEEAIHMNGYLLIVGD